MPYHSFPRRSAWAAAGRLSALSLLFALAAVSARAAICEAPSIYVEGKWSDPDGYSWAGPGELKSGIYKTELGHIKTRSGYRINTQAAISCRRSICQVCPGKIQVTIGYSPGQIVLHPKLKRSACHQARVYLHELKHAAYWVESENWGIAEARKRLTEAFWRQEAVRTTRAGQSAAADRLSRQTREIVKQVRVEMDAWADSRHGVLDSPENYAAEQRQAEAKCGILR